MGVILGREDPLEEEITTHSSILASAIPWTEEPGGLQSIGSQRVNMIFSQYELSLRILFAKICIATRLTIFKN